MAVDQETRQQEAFADASAEVDWGDVQVLILEWTGGYIAGGNVPKTVRELFDLASEALWPPRSGYTNDTEYNRNEAIRLRCVLRWLVGELEKHSEGRPLTPDSAFGNIAHEAHHEIAECRARQRI